MFYFYFLTLYIRIYFNIHNFLKKNADRISLIWIYKSTDTFQTKTIVFIVFLNIIFVKISNKLIHYHRF